MILYSGFCWRLGGVARRGEPVVPHHAGLHAPATDRRAAAQRPSAAAAAAAARPRQHSSNDGVVNDICSQIMAYAGQK